MTENEYMWAWVIYLAAVAVLYAVFWYFTGKIRWSEPKQLLRVVLPVFLLVPWISDPQYDFLAPAWIISVSDMLLNGVDAFWRAGLALVLALIITVLASSIVSIVLWLRSRKHNAEPENETDAPANVESS